MALVADARWSAHRPDFADFRHPAHRSQFAPHHCLRLECGRYSRDGACALPRAVPVLRGRWQTFLPADRKSTRLNSSHVAISYAVFCLKKKNQHTKDVLRILM